MYIIPGGMELKDAIVFPYEESLTAGATTGADCRTAKAVETHEQEVESVEGEESADVIECGISSSFLRFWNSEFFYLS